MRNVAFELLTGKGISEHLSLTVGLDIHVIPEAESGKGVVIAINSSFSGSNTNNSPSLVAIMIRFEPLPVGPNVPPVSKIKIDETH